MRFGCAAGSASFATISLGFARFQAAAPHGVKMNAARCGAAELADGLRLMKATVARRHFYFAMARRLASDVNAGFHWPLARIPR